MGRALVIERPFRFSDEKQYASRTSSQTQDAAMQAAKAKLEEAMITHFLHMAALTIVLGAPANVVASDVGLTAPIVMAQAGIPPAPAGPANPDEFDGGWGWGWG